MFGFSGYWAFQWPEIFKFGRWNWVNFDFCNVNFEVNWFKGKHFECVFIILGLGFYLGWDDKATRDRWVADSGKSFDELLKDINDENS